MSATKKQNDQTLRQPERGSREKVRLGKESIIDTRTILGFSVRTVVVVIDVVVQVVVIVDVIIVVVAISLR